MATSEFRRILRVSSNLGIALLAPIVLVQPACLTLIEMADQVLADESTVTQTDCVAAQRSAINPAATKFTARPRQLVGFSFQFAGHTLRKNHALDDVVAQRRDALRASRSEKVTRQSRYQRRSKRGLRSRGRKLGRVPHCSAITSPSRLALRGTLSPVATSTTRLPGQIHGRQDR